MLAPLNLGAPCLLGLAKNEGRLNRGQAHLVFQSPASTENEGVLGRQKEREEKPGQPRPHCPHVLCSLSLRASRPDGICCVADGDIKSGFAHEERHQLGEIGVGVHRFHNFIAHAPPHAPVCRVLLDRDGDTRVDGSISVEGEQDKQRQRGLDVMPLSVPQRTSASEAKMASMSPDLSPLEAIIGRNGKKRGKREKCATKATPSKEIIN